VIVVIVIFVVLSSSPPSFLVFWTLFLMTGIGTFPNKVYRKTLVAPSDFRQSSKKVEISLEYFWNLEFQKYTDLDPF